VLLLQTRLIQLNETIREQSDQFFKLKETGREASIDALAGFFEQATRLGGQDFTQINVLKESISSAQQQLKELLSGPQNSTTTQAIANLRGEIQQSEVELANARAGVKTWRDLFIDAIQQVLEALVRVSSQMLATSIVERILSFSLFGGAAAGGLGKGLTSGGATGVANAAEGGLITGPWAPAGVDNIPIMAQAGEGIVTREGMMRIGLRGLSNINYGEGIAPMQRTDPRHYAAGGLVEANAARGALSGKAVISVETSPDLVARHIPTTKVKNALVDLVATERHSFLAALGIPAG
jgi:hypothetical protein